MVAFSKYALLGDLLVTPVTEAIEALPTDLVTYIGKYVTHPKIHRIGERVKKIKNAKETALSKLYGDKFEVNRMKIIINEQALQFVTRLQKEMIKYWITHYS